MVKINGGMVLEVLNKFKSVRIKKGRKKFVKAKIEKILI